MGTTWKNGSHHERIFLAPGNVLSNNFGRADLFSVRVGNYMKPWQHLVLISAGAGAGAVLATALVLLTMVLYSARPKNPAPWNGNAIQAKYNEVGTGSTSNGQTPEILFYYVVTNETDSDYKVDQADSITMMAKLEAERSLLRQERITIDR